MSNNLTLQALGLTSIKDPRLTGTTNSSTQQRPFYKRKIRPKKHERLHNYAGPNETPMRIGLSNSVRPIVSPVEYYPDPSLPKSNGQTPSNPGLDQEVCIMKSESTKLTKPPSAASTSSDGSPLKRAGITTTEPLAKDAVTITSNSYPGRAPVTSTSTLHDRLDTTPEDTHKRVKSGSGLRYHGDDVDNSDQPSAKKLKSNFAPITPFSWELYLKFKPAEVAPKEAFMQTQTPLINRFQPKMKLEARDPRNKESWCLASVVTTESIGLRVKLRFEGGDGTNDFYELIDSENIRPYGTSTVLHPPVAYKGNIANYPKFVDKVVSRPDTVIAPPNCFVDPPPRPEANLFKEGMKLEAIDRKNPYLICPATVGGVNGTEIKILFDGWSGSFDYSCPYYSRDIFPVNWCHSTNHYIAAPYGWEQLVGDPVGTKKIRSPAPKLNKLISTPKPSEDSRNNSTKTRAKGRPKVQKMTNSTPKRNTPKQKLEESIINEDEDQDTTLNQDESLDDDLYDFPGISKYQCQRTVPYCEWLKLKSNVGTEVDLDMPSTTTSSEQMVNQDQTQSNCQNVSDSSSQQSAILEPRSEKPKTDNETEIPESRIVTDKRPEAWTVGDVSSYLINSDESLVKYINVFENHEIDGKAFLLLSIDIMMSRMGLKVGPALKINNLIEQIKNYK